MYDIDGNFRKLGVPKKPRKGMPPDVIRKMMMENPVGEPQKFTGAKAKCPLCDEVFTLKYMKYVVLGNFRNGYCCRDCVKEYNLLPA